VFPDGTVDNVGNPHRTQVFTSGEATAATDVLKQVIGSGTGTAAGFGCPAAGKTGTAENLANAWFAGYTPKLSTAVWVGYPQGNVPMANGFGGSLAAPIWHDFMQVASNGYCGDFPTPDSTFSGTAFTGPHSAGNGASYSKSGQNGAFGNSGTTYTNPYSNPNLYAQPTTTSGGTGTTGSTPAPGTGSGTGSGGKNGGTGGGTHGTGRTGGGNGSGGAGVKTH
jgi:penicillin-binding protein 1A